MFADLLRDTPPQVAQEGYNICFRWMKSVRTLHLLGDCHRLPGVVHLRFAHHGTGFPPMSRKWWCASSLSEMVSTTVLTVPVTRPLPRPHREMKHGCEWTHLLFKRHVRTPHLTVKFDRGSYRLFSRSKQSPSGCRKACL